MSKLYDFLNKNKHTIFIILIFIMAFAIRGHLLKYDYMFEYDPYWHLRATGYVLQGDLPDNDPLGFYQQGGSSYESRPKFLWYFTSFLYILLTFGAAYDKWLLMSFARYLPAIFGACISIAMYFLGKEIYNRKAGYIMAVIAATIPAFVYRTMAGFFEEDALGFLWLVIGFIFLIKALKHMHATKKHLTYGLISAIFFGLMSFTWAMFILIPLVLVSYFIGNLIYMAYKNSSNYEMGSFIKIFLVVFILFAAFASLYNGNGWINKTTSYVTEYMPITQENIARANENARSETDVVGATVGEENTGKQFFLLKYNFNIWIPFLAILLIPIYLLFSKKKDYYTLILFFWILITTFMAWTKLKFTYTLGIPIAAGAGFLYFLADTYFSNKGLLQKRITTFFVMFLLLTSVGAGIHFVSTKIPPIDEQEDWKEALFWIKDNTPKDSKLFNWWDYGHWLTYFSERKVSTDNTNSYVEADSDFAKFFLSTDMNFSKSMLKEYDSDYVILDSSYFNRFNSFSMYANMTTNTSHPDVQKYYGSIIDCQTVSSNNEVALRCGGGILSKDDFLDLPNKWNNKPNEIMQNTPIYMYRDTNYPRIYIFNSEVNNTIISKLWFNDEDIDFLDLIYNKGNVYIYKVKKDLL